MGIVIKNVNKSYGSKKVVDNITFEMEKPSVFGLLGTNGAGKTTTIRMILGILKKDSGKITWDNKIADCKNNDFGYLPEERGLYPKVKIIDQLIYFAKLKGMDKEIALERLDYWFKRLKVEEYREMTPEKLSKGNQQKIQFIIAVLHDPKLVILDEPFSGLDPVNTELLKNIVSDLVKDKKYIIMSSHQMSSIEEFCTEVLILNKGKTVIQGNLNEIKNSYDVKELLINSSEDINKYLNKVEYNHSDNTYNIKINSKEEGFKIIKKLIEDNIIIDRFEFVRPSLHDIFVEKVKEGVDYE